MLTLKLISRASGVGRLSAICPVAEQRRLQSARFAIVAYCRRLGPMVPSRSNNSIEASALRSEIPMQSKHFGRRDFLLAGTVLVGSSMLPQTVLAMAGKPKIGF